MCGVLPGTVCEIPGYFRISLMANEEMIERAPPRFAAAMKEAREASPTGQAVAAGAGRR